MSKVIIQNKEKAEIIKNVYHLQHEECSLGYEFELNDKFREALEALS
jgi:hypothetical protein